MTSIRYTFLLFACWFFAGTKPVQAQCDIILDSQVNHVTCFGEATGSINLVVSNGTAPYNFSWSNNQTTEDLSGLVAGTYTVTVTDDLTCTATLTVVVTEPPILIVVVDDLTLTCATPSGSVLANVSGGVPPYNYFWGNGSTTNPTMIQQPGLYSLTVTDANGCTAGGTALVTFNGSTPVVCVGPPQTLTCAVTQLQLDATCSSQGPNFFYAWSTVGGNIAGGQGTLNPTITSPGVYSLTVTNAVNGCTAVASVVVTQDVTAPLAISAGPDLEIPCGGGTVALAGNLPGGPNFTFLWATANGHILSGVTTLNPIVSEPGTYTLLVTNTFNGCTGTDDVVVTIGNSGLCSEIQGRVVLDTMANCLNDAGEPGLAGWIVKAEGALGTFYAVTDANGDYHLFAEAGDTYSVSAIALSVLWVPCPSIPDIVVANPNEILFADDLLFQKLAGCPLLTVDITSGNLRRCFSNNFFSVSYCNEGTETAEDAYVLVTLDPLFTPLGSSIPYTNLGAGVLQFNIGDVEVADCGSFNFFVHIDCNATLGQTHCTEAHIYPDSLCQPPNVLWSGASLQISSECTPDSVRFRIENVGIGNMPNALDYIVIEDLVMLMSAPVQLDAGEFVTVSLPANGSTWRLEVEQEPFHPGQSNPAVSVEGCTTGQVFSIGFVNQFAANDADEFIDIHCLANTGSYDPNDKQGFPLGYGAQHYIRPGTPLEYQIRFQNTGNDTAFTVRVVDTLSASLDPATFRAGASSHPYTWDLSGAGVLSFLFENILLPDSNVNEPASHGFFKFTINHRTDAPLETVIENTAEIYFDFNDAIVTNTTSHKLGENFVTVGLWQPQQANYEVIVAPNPFSDATWLEVKGLRQYAPLHLQVFDLQGKIQLEMDTEDSRFQLKRGHLSAGVYFFKIEQEGKNVGTGKLVIQGR